MCTVSLWTETRGWCSCRFTFVSRPPQKQTTRTDYTPSKPVVTPMPLAPTPPPPGPARLPTPPLPPPAVEPTKPPAGSSTISRQNSTTSSDNGSVAMRDQNSQRPAAGTRESNASSDLSVKTQKTELYCVFNPKKFPCTLLESLFEIS